MNILSSINILLTHVFINNYYMEPINKTGWLNSDNISILISLLNLIFIVSFYLYDKKIKKQDDNIRRKSFWYRNIIIEKNINEVEDLWESSILALSSILEDINNDTLRIKMANDVLQKKRLIINKMHNYIRIIDEDIGIKLDLILDDFEDYFTTFIDNINNDISEDDKKLIMRNFEKEIYNLKEKYFEALYKFELDGYCCKG